MQTLGALTTADIHLVNILKGDAYQNVPREDIERYGVKNVMNEAHLYLIHLKQMGTLTTPFWVMRNLVYMGLFSNILSHEIHTTSSKREIIEVKGILRRLTDITDVHQTIIVRLSFLRQPNMRLSADESPELMPYDPAGMVSKLKNAGYFGADEDAEEWKAKKEFNAKLKEPVTFENLVFERRRVTEEEEKESISIL
jgi:hypothetical protein